MRIRMALAFFLLVCVPWSSAGQLASWRGTLHDANGNSIAGAIIILRAVPLSRTIRSRSGAQGGFAFSQVPPATYSVLVSWRHRTIAGTSKLTFALRANRSLPTLSFLSQTAIDPSFAIRFFQNERNVGIHYSRTVSPAWTAETTAGSIRSTPLFPSLNTTQPALMFADGIYEPFDSAGGTIDGAYGNLRQLRQDFTNKRGHHTFQMGAETRFNHDTTVFGVTAGPATDHRLGSARHLHLHQRPSLHCLFGNSADWSG